jgi:hypothetical protein
VASRSRRRAKISELVWVYATWEVISSVLVLKFRYAPLSKAEPFVGVIDTGDRTIPHELTRSLWVPYTQLLELLYWTSND